MPRKTLSTAELYAVLVLEFRKRRPAACGRCQVPLPIFREPPDTVSANWHIGTPTPCAHHCDSVLAELMADLWTRYSLAQATEESKSA